MPDVLIRKTLICVKEICHEGGSSAAEPLRRADEIALAPVMTTGPRIHARVGGLAASEIKGEEGLR